MNPNAKSVEAKKVTRTTKNPSRIVNKSIESQNPSKFLKKGPIEDEIFPISIKKEQQKKSRKSENYSLSISRSNKSLISSKASVKLLSQSPDLEDIDVLEVFRQNQQLKIMELSQDCRQNLVKMQRFDRFIYPIESDRILKAPIQKQVKRLQKIKNQNPRMRGKIYDNQLTITALFNHVKLVFEMNRELEQRQVLRRQKDTLSKKMHEMKVQNTKQVRELKDTIRQQQSQGTSPMKFPPKPPAPQQSHQFSKQQNTALSFIDATITGKKYNQALKEIQQFKKKYGNRQEVCKVLQITTKTIQQHITIEKHIKTIQSNYVQVNNLIEKINKSLRAQHYDQLIKLKNQHIKSDHKNIALMLQSLTITIKKLQQNTQKNNKRTNDDRSLSKINSKCQKLQQQIKQLKNQLSQQKMLHAQNLKNKVSLEKQIQKLKLHEKEIDSSAKKQTNIESSTVVIKLKAELAKQKTSHSELTKSKDELNKSLVQQTSKNKSLQIQIDKYKSQIDDLKQKIKVKQQTSPSKQQKQKDLLKNRNIQKQLQTMKESLQGQKKQNSALQQSLRKLTQLFKNKLINQQGIAKLKRQLEQGNSQHNVKFIQILQIYTSWQEEKKQLQNQMQENKKNNDQKIKGYQEDYKNYEKIQNSIKNLYVVLERKKGQILNRGSRVGDIILSQLKRQRISQELTIVSEISALTNWIQDLYIQHSNQIVQQKENTISNIQIEIKNKYQLETKKKLQNTINQQRKYLTNIDKTIKHLWTFTQKLRSENFYKDNKFVQLLNKQLKPLKQSQWASIFVQLQAIFEYLIHSCNDEIIKREDIGNRKIQNLQSQIDQLKNQLKQLNEEIHNRSVSRKQQQNNIKKLNRQTQITKKQAAKLSNQKKILQNREKQSNTEIAKLKKIIQEYVQEQKKILQKYQRQQSDKQHHIRQIQSLKRSLQKAQQQKQLHANNTRKQNSDLVKYRQLQHLYENSHKNYEHKITTLENNLTTRDKQYRQVNEKCKQLQTEKNKHESHRLQTEKSLTQQNVQLQRARKSAQDKSDELQKQKYQLNKSVERLNSQIKYLNQENQNEKKRLGSTIQRLQKQFKNIQEQRQRDRKQLTHKVNVLMKEKQEIRDTFQNQQLRYREKLREATFKIQQTTTLEQNEKLQLTQNINKITSQLTTLTQNFEVQKSQLQRQITKQVTEIHTLQSQKNQSSHRHREQVQKVRNQQYESNRQKLRKNRDQIKCLQQQHEKLTEVIEINQINYNKIIEDNKNMYEKILQIQQELTQKDTMLKNKIQQNQNNYELSQYISTLEIKIKQLQNQMNKHQNKNDESQVVLRQKYQHINQISKQNTTLKIQYKNLQKTSAQNSKKLTELTRDNSQLNKLLKERETQLIHKNNIVFQNQLTFKQKQGQRNQHNNQINRINQQINNLKNQLQRKNQSNKLIEREKNKLQSKIMDIQKNSFQVQLNLKKEVQVLTGKYQGMLKEILELREYRENKQRNQKANQGKYQEYTREIMVLKIQNGKLEKDISHWREKADKRQEQYSINHQHNHNQKRTIVQKPEIHYDNSAKIILQQELQNKKIEYERLNLQNCELKRKYEEKSQQKNRVCLQLKEKQMQAKFSEQNYQQRIETLNQKYKDQRQRHRNQKLHSEQILTQLEYQKKSLSQKLSTITLKFQATYGQLQKSRMASQNLLLFQKQQKQKNIQEKTTHIQYIQRAQDVNTRKIKQQNKELKQLLFMLDEKYVGQEDDWNQITILMKISQEIGQLLKRNTYLEKINKKYVIEQDDHWYQSMDIFVDSIIQYVYQNNYIRKNTKLDKYITSAHFRSESDHDLAVQEFFIHTEKLIKSLFNKTVESLNEEANLYERTLGQLKMFADNYQKTNNKVYLDSLVKCLRSFES